MGLPLASWGWVIWHEVDGMAMFFLPSSGFLCLIIGLSLFCDACYEVKTQAKSIMFQNPWGIQVTEKAGKNGYSSISRPKVALCMLENL